MSGPTPTLWRSRLVMIPSRCAAAAPVPPPWKRSPPGWSRVRARQSPSHRPGAIGSRSLRSWRRVAARASSSIRSTCSRARAGPHVTCRTAHGANASLPWACWPARVGRPTKGGGGAVTAASARCSGPLQPSRARIGNKPSRRCTASCRTSSARAPASPASRSSAPSWPASAPLGRWPSGATPPASTTRAPSPAPCRAIGAPSLWARWPQRWPCRKSITRKSPHAIGTARPLCRRSPTVARGRRGHPRPGRGNGAVPSQRAPGAPPCTGSPGETCPRLRALPRRRPGASSARWGWIGVAGRPCNTARRGWAAARTTGCQGAQSCVGGPRPGPTGRRPPSGWPPHACTTARVLSEPSSDGCKPGWAPPKPAPRRRPRLRGCSTACASTARRMSGKAWTTTRHRPATGR